MSVVFLFVKFCQSIYFFLSNEVLIINNRGNLIWRINFWRIYIFVLQHFNGGEQ